MLGANLAAKAGSVAAERISIRLGFLRKVFGILSFQLLMTITACTVLYLTPGVRGFVQQQSWILLLTTLGSIGLLIAMYIHAHNVPTNYMLLAAFTLMQSLTLGAIVSFFDLEVIIEAAALTTVVVLGLFFYTLQSKRDFSASYATVYSLSSILLMASILQVFLLSTAFTFFVNVAAAGIFCVFLVYDIDLIMHHLSPEDYIFACITLYMDIINLFVRLLQILNELNRN